MDAPRDAGCLLFAGSNAAPLTASERTALLEAARAGESVELQLEAITFIQRDTPNRNFVRFPPGVLATFAKSFEGQPFLRDHASYDLASRGGTIIASKLEHNPDGSKQMRMRLQLVKPWAVEGALDGTIDRFSIGWDRNGVAAQCSVHLADFWSCSCRLGSTTEDGKTVELLVTKPTGTEVSGVNVPAVVGTHIGSISQLDAIDPTQLAYILGSPPNSVEPEPMDPKTRVALIVALGLAADATDEQIAAGASATAAKLAISEKADGEKSAQLAAIAADQAKRGDVERQATIETAITELKTLGKLKPQGDPEEAELRAFALTSMDVFAFAVKAKRGAAPVTAAGAPLPALGRDPAPTAPSDTKAMLAAKPEVAKWLAKAGISEADFEKHGASARDFITAVGG